MIMLYLLRCQGIHCELEQLYQWVLADVQDLTSVNRTGFGRFLSPKPQVDQHVRDQGHMRILIETRGTAEFQVNLTYTAHRRLPPLYAAFALMLTQDIYCALERRGFHVSHMLPRLAWE